MKKFIVFLLLVVLSVTPAFAEEYDVSSLSTEELIALLENVRLELTERIGLVEDNRIGQGVYVVGKDIKAGSYDFLCLDTEVKNDEPLNSISLYTVAEDGVSQDERLWFIDGTAINEHFVLNLSEGTILEIWKCSGLLTETQPSWVP